MQVFFYMKWGMIMNKLYFGYTTMTHGLKGELKCYTDFEKKDKVLTKGFPIYIQDSRHTITSARSHKNHYLITIDHLNDINLVEEFRNQKIYIDRVDLKLNEDEFLMSDLLDFSIIEEEETLGIVEDILYNKSGIYLKVLKEKTYYIPWQEAFIVRVDKNKKQVLVQNAKGLML